MIDFYNGQIVDILPDSIRGDPVVTAISYAVSNMVKRIVQNADKSCIYAAVDVLDEDILDLLAVELRSQYYSSDLAIDKKRNIIKNTLSWYYKAGTPSAMLELVRIVFGPNSRVEEWWQYSGEPYMFKIVVDDQEHLLTDEQWEKMKQIIKYVKNTRSHLESIQYLRAGEMKLHAGIGTVGYSVSVIG